KTLEAIFERPTRANLVWADVEKLVVALGGNIESKGGSSIRIRLKGEQQFLHRPHPQKEAKRYMIDDMRTFFEEIGITP
ncbi:MAG: type II toxin-antitoxin system HicA family toxin, partial [Alphaproteobacteria bacterium]|nr:type II toxin-antitoxin system HicA family toxin [Alphaproteobacteria bacterium]